MSASSLLVIDVGTSGLRAAIVRPDATVAHVRHRSTPPATPFPGLVEFDAAAMARHVLELAHEVLAAEGTVGAVGIAAQRASTIVWDRATGVPVAPALGWQDLRTIGECLVAKAEHGLAIAPNQSVTKLAHLLDAHDPGRERDLCFGTVDTWVAWTLSDGELHVTDRTNAAVTGLLLPDASAWNPRVLELFRIPERMLPALVDSTGPIGPATALPGAPLIAGIAGDQQASLIGPGLRPPRPGQDHLRHGRHARRLRRHRRAGVGGPQRPRHVPDRRLGGGGDDVVWGAEAIMLSAGSNVDWLVEDLGPARLGRRERRRRRSRCRRPTASGSCPPSSASAPPSGTTAPGAPSSASPAARPGPTWCAPCSKGSPNAGADLVDAAEADTGLEIPTIRLDGGMGANATFVQAVADATGRPGRGGSDHRGHDVGCRLPRRPRHRHLGCVRRPRRPVATGSSRSSRRARRTAMGGGAGVDRSRSVDT